MRKHILVLIFKIIITSFSALYTFTLLTKINRISKVGAKTPPESNATFLIFNFGVSCDKVFSCSESIQKTITTFIYKNGGKNCIFQEFKTYSIKFNNRYAILKTLLRNMFFILQDTFDYKHFIKLSV